MTNQEAAEMIRDDMKLHHDYLSGTYRKALNMAISALQAQDKKSKTGNSFLTESADVSKEWGIILRRAAINAICDNCDTVEASCPHYPCGRYVALEKLPSAQPEPLTDKEKRIFLAAMEREEKICEEVDRNYVREPYKDNLMRICKEIRRKVRGALWI